MSVGIATTSPCSRRSAAYRNTSADGDCALIRRISAGNSRPLAEGFGRRSAPRSLPFCARRYHTPRYHAMTAFIGYYFGVAGCNLHNCWEFTACASTGTLPRCQFVCIAQRSARLLDRSFRLLRNELRAAKIDVRERSGAYGNARRFSLAFNIQIGSHGLFSKAASIPLPSAISATLPY